jgi:hypothetical protein
MMSISTNGERGRASLVGTVPGAAQHGRICTRRLWQAMLACTHYVWCTKAQERWLALMISKDGGPYYRLCNC